MAALCKNRIQDNIGANYHIFMNSVRGISEIIRYAGLDPKDVRVICAAGQSRAKNEAKLPEGFRIASTTDPVKVINFYTATCFEGTDIYDNIGRTFIVCDPHRPNTLMDISTSMIQICGRIRNSQFNNQLTLIYNNSRYEDAATVEEFERQIQKEVNEAEKNAEQINGMTGKMRKNLIDNIQRLDAPFLSVNGDTLEVDKNRINLDIINFKIVNGIYKTRYNINTALLNNGFKVVEETDEDNNLMEVLALSTIKYSECCELYHSIKEKQSGFVFKEDEQLVRLRNIHPGACEAVDKLGIREVRRMKYHKSNIHKKLLSMSRTAQDIKIHNEISRRFQKHTAYPIPRIKQVLAEIYNTVGLAKSPRATDLER